LLFIVAMYVEIYLVSSSLKNSFYWYILELFIYPVITGASYGKESQDKQKN